MTVTDWLNAFARMHGVKRDLTDEELKRGMEWLDSIPVPTPLVPTPRVPC